MQYRRSQLTGGIFFLTLVTYNRIKIFSDIQNVNLLRQVIHKIKQSHPFIIDAFVLLPDHLHCIWTLPTNDKDFSTRWRLIKSNFTRSCHVKFKTLVTSSRKIKGEQCIWQRRFWEQQIKDEKDYLSHVDYIHYNPIKHRYFKTPKEWLYSSFHHYVKAKLYDINWCLAEPAQIQRVIENE